MALFERRHRALALTRAGAAFHRTVTEKLRELRAAADALQAPHREPALTVSTTVRSPPCGSSRGCRVSRRASRVDVYVSADDRMVDLAKGDVDVAIRYLAHPRAPDNATFLFGERFMPVASPALVKRGPRLAKPADLAHYVLLHFDDPEGRMPWINWSAWLAANGAAGVKPAGRCASRSTTRSSRRPSRGRVWRSGAYRLSPASSSGAASSRPSASDTTRPAATTPFPRRMPRPAGGVGVRRMAGRGIRQVRRRPRKTSR